MTDWLHKQSLVLGFGNYSLRLFGAGLGIGLTTSGLIFLVAGC